MKRLIALFLAIATAAVLLFGSWWFLWAQPAAAIVDHTRQNTPESAAPEEEEEAVPAQAGAAGGTDPNTAVLNPNVQIFFGQDATNVYSAITGTAFDADGRLQITLNTTGAGAFAQLESGDLFFIDGDETALFQGAYIGKVAQTQADENGNTVLTVESATMDEAFDALNVDIQATLTEDSLISLEAVEGVDLQMQQDALGVYDTLEGGSNLPAPEPVSAEELAASTTTPEGQQKKLDEVQRSAQADTESVAMTGASATTEAVPLTADFTPVTPAPAKEDHSNMVGADISVGKEGIVASVEIDLAKVFGLKKTLSDGGGESGGEKQDANDAMMDSLEEGSLTHDLKQLQKASKEDPSCKIKGKIAITDLSCDLKSDWALAYLSETPLTLGFKQLGVDYSSNLLYDINFTGTLKDYSIGGVKSQFSVGSWLKLEGLPYKKFPLFCVQFGAGAPIRIASYPKSNADIAQTALDQVGSLVPVVMGVVYIDTDGKVSLTYSMDYNIECSVEGTYTVVKDSQYVWQQEPGSTQKLSRSFQASAGFEADMDLHVGAALDVFFCGVNVLDFNLIKLGAEFEGKGECKCSFSDAATSDESMDPSTTGYLDAYLRFYIKAIDIGLKMKVSLSFLNQKLFTAGLDKLRWTLFDYTLFDIGIPLDTYYDPDTMSCQSMTAEDPDNIYFLTEDGEIARQSKATGFYSVLCEATMTRFVGIDKSYLYYIKPGDQNYDLCRVSKSSGITRTILTNVANVLGEDAAQLFYTDGDDKTILQGLNRSTRNSSAFASFDDEVQLIVPYQDNYYVLTQSNDIFSMMFGGGNHYYLIDSSGNLLEDLGGSPSPHELPRWSTEKNMYTSQLVGTGQLHSHATAVYWISSTSEDSVKLEAVSGWNNLGPDVCVTQDAEEGSSLPYIIRRYSAVDGQMSDVVAVHSNQAFFTLCQAEDGSWYFFDEDTDAGELYLYRMDANFGNQTLLETYSHEDIGVSLDDCGMELIAGKLIFYSITGNDNSAIGKTLLRYDIY